MTEHVSTKRTAIEAMREQIRKTYGVEINHAGAGYPLAVMDAVVECASDPDEIGCGCCDDWMEVLEYLLNRHLPDGWAIDRDRRIVFALDVGGAELSPALAQHYSTLFWQLDDEAWQLGVITTDGHTVSEAPFDLIQPGLAKEVRGRHAGTGDRK